MDKLAYHYVAGTNQLHQVTDAVTTPTPADYNDIKTQSPGNYRYDKIGNLISDISEGISNIAWTVYGKINTITKTNGTNIKYTYDASGNRNSKIVTTATTGDSTYYVRDASGNVMSVYHKKGALALAQTELHLYGSNRLGVYNVNVDVENCLNAKNPITTFTRGNKFFELSNHLGNVLATLSDKKLQVSLDGIFVGYYLADVVTAGDYYPFGMAMPLERRYSQRNSGYRYGFNGVENDNEIKGQGNHLSFGDYGYDPKIGRRWNIDPVIQHHISPYAVFNNNPIFLVDPDGESPISIFVKQVAKAGLKKATKEVIQSMIKKRLAAYMSKSWAKQLGKDALDAIDVATSQSWWEYAIEVIPVVGDGFGAYKLGEQGYKTWKIVQKFESIADWGLKAAGKAFKTLGSNKLINKGAEAVTKYTNDINNAGKALDDETLAGAVKEIYGLNSGFKPNGVAYQHLTKTNQHLRGLSYQVGELSKDIKKGVFEGDALKAAQGILNATKKQYNEISNTLNSAKKAAANF